MPPRPPVPASFGVGLGPVSRADRKAEDGDGEVEAVALEGPWRCGRVARAGRSRLRGEMRAGRFGGGRSGADLIRRRFAGNNQIAARTRWLRLTITMGGMRRRETGGRPAEDERMGGAHGSNEDEARRCSVRRPSASKRRRGLEDQRAMRIRSGTDVP